MSTLEKFTEKNQRKCSIIIPGGFRPTDNPLTTNFAKSVVGLESENWPSYNGKPMTFICQINLDEAPYVPEILSDIKIISFFIDLDGYLANNDDSDAWCIRTYSSLDNLISIPTQSNDLNLKPFECKWELVETDLPIYDDPWIDSETDYPESHNVEHSYKTKIGGWSSNIQSEQQWYINNTEKDIRFAFQISSEEKVGLNIVDSGFIYVGRDIEKKEWAIDIQFY